LASALLFDEKISQSAALFWSGLRDNGILYSQVIVQRTIYVSPAFLEHGSAEKITVIQTSRRLVYFLHEAAQNFELLSNIQDQKYIIKTYSS
jgi:hypothetical protein